MIVIEEENRKVLIKAISRAEKSTRKGRRGIPCDKCRCLRTVNRGGVCTLCLDFPFWTFSDAPEAARLLRAREK
jgi:hypothetical protein